MSRIQRDGKKINIKLVIKIPVNRYSPHGGRVSVAVAVVVLAAVAARPHVDVAQAVTSLRERSF